MKLLLSLATLFLLVPAANAKEFRPGDLRVCGATQCRLFKDAPTSRRISELLYGATPVIRARTPRVGSPVFQLRFEGGPAGVILNETAFRVHGLNCGRFQRGQWYRLPRPLQRLAAGLKPKRLRAHVPPSC
jgi:hypothetical protein